MKEEIEKNIVQFVARTLDFDHSGHGVQHAVRVAGNARVILQKEKDGDESIILTAAYLHDCIDHKLFDDVVVQKEKVRSFLVGKHYSTPQVDEILFIMENVSFSKGRSGQLNKNGQIVCDADRLDALGALGIIRTIEYGNSRGRPFYKDEKDVEKAVVGDYDKMDKDSSLSHFYEKLLQLKDMMFTQSAKRIAEDRTLFMQEFLNEFYKEIKYGC